MKSLSDMRYLDKKKVKYIVIHCSDTFPGQSCDARIIDEWHTKQRGWAMIGYHYVILPDGRLEFGRPIYYEGAHVRGHNHESIGICLVGGRDVNYNPVDPRTVEQCRTLVDLLRELKQWHFPNAQIVGHRDLDKGKECPCFDAKCYNSLF